MGLRNASLWALVALSALGCSERTEIVVAVDSDLAVPAELDRVRFEITGPSGPQRTAEADLSSTTLPVTLGLSHGSGPLAPLNVVVVGEQGGSEVVRREARTAFRQGETRLLRMYLLRSCVGVDCADGETCGEMGCVPATVDPAGLPEWSGPPARIDGGRSVADAGPDAGSADAGSADAGSADAGPGDSGPPDAGPACGGCDDGIDCTDDVCDPDAGCSHTPVDVACDDSVDCTVDTCDVLSGCTSTPDAMLCATGDLCDVDAGACVAGATFTDVYAIVSANCSPCHTSPPYSGGLNMSSQASAYADLVDVRASCGTGNVRVIPYDARNSLLWRKLAAVDLCGNRMPNGRAALPMAQIDAVRDWINAGAADN